MKEPKKARKDAQTQEPGAEANDDIVGSGRQAAQVHSLKRILINRVYLIRRSQCTIDILKHGNLS